MQVCLRPRDRFWDIPVPKIDSAFDNLLVPQPSWSPSTTQQLRKLVAAPYLAPNDWTPRLDAYFASPLALCARRVSSAASRLLGGSTSLRFALHGWQRRWNTEFRGLQNMNNKQLITATMPTGSMESYVSAAFQLPMLSQQEEHDLAVRWHEKQDLEAARQLVMSHLRFVVRIARQYAGYGLPQPDLVQEGTVGLMKAVRRFDPNVGVRLASFAVHWIKAEIHEFILRNWRIVKIATTKAQRKLFFNLRSSKKRLGWFTEQEVQDVASDLGVKPEEVRNMEARLNNYDMAFDPMDADSEDEHVAPASYLPDMRMEPESILEAEDTERDENERLYAAMEELDERSQDILRRRWLSEKKATLHELADEYGISAERIRQIEKAAMNKLQDRIAA